MTTHLAAIMAMVTAMAIITVTAIAVASVAQQALAKPLPSLLGTGDGNPFANPALIAARKPPSPDSSPEQLTLKQIQEKFPILPTDSNGSGSTGDENSTLRPPEAAHQPIGTGTMLIQATADTAVNIADVITASVALQSQSTKPGGPSKRGSVAVSSSSTKKIGHTRQRSASDSLSEVSATFFSPTAASSSIEPTVSQQPERSSLTTSPFSSSAAPQDQARPSPPGSNTSATTLPSRSEDRDDSEHDEDDHARSRSDSRDHEKDRSRSPSPGAGA